LEGSVLLVSGPSGSGKSSLCNKLFEQKKYYFSISTTTRAPRAGEKHAKEYYFVSKNEFKQNIKDDKFLEWAVVHDNYYGTYKKPVLDALKNGSLVLFDIDVQGMVQIKKSEIAKYCTSVFITTKTEKDLELRLIKRGLDHIDTIQKRVQTAKQEMSYIDQYDYCIINDDFDTAFFQLKTVVKLLNIKGSSFNKSLFTNNW
jgi:guanylate kinase